MSALYLKLEMQLSRHSSEVQGRMFMFLYLPGQMSENSCFHFRRSCNHSTVGKHVMKRENMILILTQLLQFLPHPDFVSNPLWYNMSEVVSIPHWDQSDFLNIWFCVQWFQFPTGFIILAPRPDAVQPKMIHTPGRLLIWLFFWL